MSEVDDRLFEARDVELRRRQEHLARAVQPIQTAEECAVIRQAYERRVQGWDF